MKYQDNLLIPSINGIYPGQSAGTYLQDTYQNYPDGAEWLRSVEHVGTLLGDISDPQFPIPESDAPLPEVPLPSYVTAADIDDFVTQINANKPANALQFVVVTDVHASHNDADSPDLTTDGKRRFENYYIACDIANKLRAGFFANLGDMCSDDTYGMPPTSNNARYLDDLQYTHDIIKQYCTRPYYAIRGNHDLGLNDGNDYAHYITPQQFYEKTEEPFIESGPRAHNAIGTEEYRSYYYTDFPASKVRLIMLDASDIPSVPFTESGGLGYRSPQMKWLATVALNMPNKSGWAVVIGTHMGINSTANGGSTIVNAQILEGIMRAFTTGDSYSITFNNTNFNNASDSFSVNYASQGAKHAFGMHGHTHADNKYVSPTIYPFNYVALACSFPQGASSGGPSGATSIPTSVRHDSTKPLNYPCITVFRYNPTNYSMDIFRFGAPSETFTNTYDYTNHKGTYPATTISLIRDIPLTINTFSIEPVTIGPEGGTATATVVGVSLKNANSLAINFNGTNYPITNWTNSLASVVINVPENTGSSENVLEATLYIDGSATTNKAYVTVEAGGMQPSQYALRLGDNNIGSWIDLPFGADIPVTTFSKVVLKFRTKTLWYGTNSRPTQYIMTSYGPVNRFNIQTYNNAFGYAYGGTTFTQGSTTWANGSGVIDPNMLTMELAISTDGTRLVSTIDNTIEVKEDINLVTNNFNLLANFTIGWTAGRSGGEANQFWGGILYDLRFYASDGTTYAWYNFSDGNGNTITDISGNGRHGTLNGGYAWVPASTT